MVTDNTSQQPPATRAPRYGIPGASVARVNAPVETYQLMIPIGRTERGHTRYRTRYIKGTREEAERALPGFYQEVLVEQAGTAPPSVPRPPAKPRQRRATAAPKRRPRRASAKPTPMAFRFQRPFADLGLSPEEEAAASEVADLTGPSASDIAAVCDGIKSLLLAKNAKYGDSALHPVRIFSRADPVEQLKVRLDDKLSRIMQMGADPAADEDTFTDFLGYCVLLAVAMRRAGRWEQVVLPADNHKQRPKRKKKQK